MQAFIWFLMHHLSQAHWKVHGANLAREGGAFAAAFHFHGFSWPPWSWWCVMSWDPLPVALSFFLRCYLSVRWPIRPDPLVLRTLILWIIGCGGWKSKGLPRRSFSCGCKGMEKKKKESSAFGVRTMGIGHNSQLFLPRKKQAEMFKAFDFFKELWVPVTLDALFRLTRPMCCSLRQVAEINDKKPWLLDRKSFPGSSGRD